MTCNFDLPNLADGHGNCRRLITANDGEDQHPGFFFERFGNVTAAYCTGNNVP